MRNTRARAGAAFCCVAPPCERKSAPFVLPVRHRLRRADHLHPRRHELDHKEPAVVRGALRVERVPLCAVGRRAASRRARGTLRVSAVIAHAKEKAAPVRECVGRGRQRSAAHGSTWPEPLLFHRRVVHELCIPLQKWRGCVGTQVLMVQVCSSRRWRRPQSPLWQVMSQEQHHTAACWLNRNHSLEREGAHHELHVARAPLVEKRQGALSARGSELFHLRGPAASESACMPMSVPLLQNCASGALGLLQWSQSAGAPSA